MIGSAIKAATVSAPSLKMRCSSESAIRLGERFLGFAGQPETIEMRTFHMQDVGDRQVEIAMIVRQVR